MIFKGRLVVGFVIVEIVLALIYFGLWNQPVSQQSVASLLGANLLITFVWFVFCLVTQVIDSDIVIIAVGICLSILEFHLTELTVVEMAMMMTLIWGPVILAAAITVLIGKWVNYRRKKADEFPVAERQF